MEEFIALSYLNSISIYTKSSIKLCIIKLPLRHNSYSYRNTKLHEVSL